MQVYPKKRVEIIVEAPVVGRLTRILEDERVTGYTVFPALSGKGLEGEWSREGVVTDAGRMVAVVCIVSEERKDRILERVFELISHQIGIVSVTDCEVVRGDRF